MATPQAPPDLGVKAGYGVRSQILPFTRGRGGDMDPAYWSAGRVRGEALITTDINSIRPATIYSPSRRLYFGGTQVWPPDDILKCDSSSSFNGMVMLSAVIQNYGAYDLMRRQTFDFTGRTGTITCEVDAQCVNSLATYIQLSITDDPISCPSFFQFSNEEPGPSPKNGIVIAFNATFGSGTNSGVGDVYVYTNYVPVAIAPSFQLTGASMSATVQDQLNRIQVLITATDLQIWMSDNSTDGGVTFPNFQRVWEGTIASPITKGFVHYGVRNHATVKYGYPTVHVYHFQTIDFDGSKGPLPSAFEIADNSPAATVHMSGDTSENDYPYPEGNLGYQVSDGSDGRSAGVYGIPGVSAPLLSPLKFLQAIDLTGKRWAQLVLTLWCQSVTHTPDTTWTLLYTFNGGTQRQRSFTGAEVSNLINNSSTAGWLALVINVPFGDLVQGYNTIDFSSLNLPMDYPPEIMNIDLLLWADMAAFPSESLKISDTVTAVRN
jgi:hypothetical protein